MSRPVTGWASGRKSRTEVATHGRSAKVTSTTVAMESAFSMSCLTASACSASCSQTLPVLGTSPSKAFLSCGHCSIQDVGQSVSSQSNMINAFNCRPFVVGVGMGSGLKSVPRQVIQTVPRVSILTQPDFGPQLWPPTASYRRSLPDRSFSSTTLWSCRRPPLFCCLRSLRTAMPPASMVFTTFQYTAGFGAGFTSEALAGTRDGSVVSRSSKSNIVGELLAAVAGPSPWLPALEATS
mmetsp:Transcript_41326/g.131453  ORF Transcript_41326/g.131453 Transcript_41326/m.131453 type:complete len:238 (+) Transcript_41326:499-1212(+)